eukprot:TRINITY_DN5135_c1_g1_i1.p1 TRINITY_DN5135_c1_g1~~TRINITY_DN5135_c1_g1_i1.p1  ORF type:complete len:406 (+),score=55.15 TRINITY_DN5135_c1_g1_i1:43-1218(+)
MYGGRERDDYRRDRRPRQHDGGRRYRDDRQDWRDREDRRERRPRRDERHNEGRRGSIRDRNRSSSEVSAEVEVQLQEIPEDRMKKIVESVKGILGVLTMPPMKLAMCNALREYIENMIQNEADAKRVKVNVIGGWMSNTALVTDPVDLEVTGPYITGKRVLKWLLADTFRDVEYKRRTSRQQSRVVKTECDPKSDRMIDTLKFAITNGGNEMRGTHSTAVIMAYAVRSILVSELVRGLKRWGKLTGVVPGVLDSYSLTLMVIYFLLMKDEITWLDPSNVKDPYPPPTEVQYPYLTSQDREQLLLLFPKFFFFYAYEFNYDATVISLSLDELLPKSHARYSTHQYRNRCIHIEDPASPGSNLTQHIDANMFSSLIEMIHATNQAMAVDENEL